ncbi:hypothetical protein CIPAW_04G014800 [Carya illinoinensis]|uniref:Uncharacterized protein n=1 Tax=Carya illinoinensis TaxID=32201 RepID=A0A8T1QP08_CARIL|nr:hypothetical protein CIPAW_04G014800 [Carya illinoinensis]
MANCWGSTADNPTPSTTAYLNSGYHSPVNPYYPTYMMTTNTYSNPYLYH